MFISNEYNFFDYNHSIFLMHPHSYFITNIYYFNFRFYHISTTIFLWSHSLSCWRNARHNWRYSGFSIFTNTIVLNYTCEYYNAYSYDKFLLSFSSLCYCLWIRGHRCNCFVDSIDHRREQRGNRRFCFEWIQFL